MEAPSIARTRKYQKTLWNVNRLRDSKRVWLGSLVN